MKRSAAHCGTHQNAPSPENVKAPVQYGDNWIAYCAYLHTYHHLPLERICQLFHDMTGYRPSEATLLQRLSSISTKIEPHTAYIREELLKSAVVQADETGMRIDNKTQWLHTVSNSDWTLIMSMKKKTRM